MKNKIFKIIICSTIIVFACLVLMVFPFLIEWMLFDTEHMPFNIPIRFSREAWFGFIASYLGAIGTVILGIIALYQNKKYKELSDKSETNLLNLQNDIRELNRKSVELIEINTRIEQAKYFPVFREGHRYFWDARQEDLEDFSVGNVFQIAVKKEDNFNIEEPIEKVIENYHTFTFFLTNNGEKVIRNFHCKEAKVNGKSEMGAWYFYNCDIESGATACVMYATKIDLVKEIRKGNISTIEFEYGMENLIGESLHMDIQIVFFNTKGKLPSVYVNMGSVLYQDEKENY
ncbi:MAG: hypothetical protein NC417_07375 [Candidatus Gastranaerophilales bacterium]|nr:hypothetical protein [Candidatus Gastranaerophilales bacterium]